MELNSKVAGSIAFGYLLFLRRQNPSAERMEIVAEIGIYLLEIKYATNVVKRVIFPENAINLSNKKEPI